MKGNYVGVTRAAEVGCGFCCIFIVGNWDIMESNCHDVKGEGKSEHQLL